MLGRLPWLSRLSPSLGTFGEKMVEAHLPALASTVFSTSPFPRQKQGPDSLQVHFFGGQMIDEAAGAWDMTPWEGFLDRSMACKLPPAS